MQTPNRVAASDSWCSSRRRRRSGTSTRRTFILDRPQRAKNRMAVIKLGSKHILDPEQRDIQLFGLQRQDETRSCNNLWLTESWEAVAFQQHSFH
jgi:hypothetical protein